MNASDERYLVHTLEVAAGLFVTQAADDLEQRCRGRPYGVRRGVGT